MSQFDTYVIFLNVYEKGEGEDLVQGFPLSWYDKWSGKRLFSSFNLDRNAWLIYLKVHVKSHGGFFTNSWIKERLV